MTKIPRKIRNVLEKMPRMRLCELHWNPFGDCEGKIEWHHVWIYAGRQIQEQWAIVAVCNHHHDMVKTTPRVKKILENYSLQYATDEELAKYPKINWAQLKKYLNVE